jgi:hypothetical protein
MRDEVTSGGDRSGDQATLTTTSRPSAPAATDLRIAIGKQDCEAVTAS